MKHPTLAILMVLAAAASSLAPVTAHAAADLLVYPTRVVLTDRARTAQVDITNTSQIQGTYKIVLGRKRMLETGEFQDVELPQPDEKYADDLVKYSPRQVTLVPGAGQTIRMMVKLPPDLPAGEYRSHLTIVQPPAAVTDLQEKADPNAVAMRIVTTIGVSIPVIIRHGDLQAKASIDPASVRVSADPAQQLVQFRLERSGTRSVYGDVVVSRGNDKIAEVGGLAVYVPNKSRNVAVTVPRPHVLKSGDVIKISFVERAEKKPVTAETTITIP